jgi:hypothetical protein
MFESNIYNLDIDFDYVTVKAIVIKSLEKIAKEEAALENTSNVLSDVKGNIDPRNLEAFAPHTIIEVKNQKYYRISYVVCCFKAR